jgi:hypothetical protein
MAGAPSAPEVPMFRRRREERALLDGLLAGARGGHSGVLVLRGEAGFGTTALLEHAIESASDLSVLRAMGVESEVELAFAALHQLCAPVLDGLDRLPGPQRDALAITTARTGGGAGQVRVGRHRGRSRPPGDGRGRRPRRPRARPRRSPALRDRVRVETRQRRAPRCCSRPPASSRPSTPAWPARPTSGPFGGALCRPAGPRGRRC